MYMCMYTNPHYESTCICVCMRTMREMPNPVQNLIKSGSQITGRCVWCLLLSAAASSRVSGDHCGNSYGYDKRPTRCEDTGTICEDEVC